MSHKARHILSMIATASAVAFVVNSCKGKLALTDAMDLSSIPIQVVDSMYVVQTENGRVNVRMEAPRMERYSADSLSYELFPNGVEVYGYTEEGLLETEITANSGKHLSFNDGRESWEAYGNVVVKNIINKQVLETDTLYWDRQNELLFTDCFVRLYSPEGYMQGYGMESDQRARHSIIKRPFNSYGIVEQDSTSVVIDSVNFIGPFQKK